MSIEVVAVVVGVLTALVVYVAESQRGRRERRDEYRADVCALVAERTAALEREIELMLEQGVASGARLLPLLRQFSVSLRGQLPRARLAGLDAAVNQMTVVLKSFLGTWHAVEGRDTVRRQLRDFMIAELIETGTSPEKATAAVDQEPGYSSEWPADQEALVRALGNYLSTARCALQDHTQKDKYVPPLPGEWPKLSGLASEGA